MLIGLSRVAGHWTNRESSIALERRDRVCPISTQRTSSTVGIEGSLSDLARHSNLTISMTYTKLIAHFTRLVALHRLRFKSSLGMVSRIASIRIYIT